MSGRKTHWFTDAAEADLMALAARWQLSRSATIAKALAQAEKGSTDGET